MKKYNMPELTISSFDVEDIMTNSGVVADFSELGLVGTLVSDTSATATAASKGVYFSWED